MSQLHFPWLELSVLIALIGSIWVSQIRDFFVASRHTLVFNTLTLVMSVGAWIDYEFFNPLGAVSHEAQDFWNPLTLLNGTEIFVIDPVSSPLLTLVALLYFLVSLTTLRTKAGRFSFAWTLVSEAIVLATFSCESARLIIPMLIAGTIPPFFELRARRQNTNVYVAHMSLYVTMLLLGLLIIELEGGQNPGQFSWSVFPLLIAVMVRSGIAPFHCWLGDLFERASFGRALLVSMPLVGVYATIRLVLPFAPDWAVMLLGLMSLVTTIYSSAIALVQIDARRFFCYLFLSYSALVLVGLGAMNPMSLTGALYTWLAVSVSLSGFGLTLRALESRRGRLSLASFQGLYNHTPALAVLFLITGLASVGFPGTFGFVGTEMLLDGLVEESPFVGVAVVISSALNGIAVVHAYFRLFMGAQHMSSVFLGIGSRERFAVISLATLIFLGGLFPQHIVATRYRAAERIFHQSNRGSGHHEVPRRDDSGNTH